MEVIQIFEDFSLFSGLNWNKSQCEKTSNWCSKGGQNGVLWYGMCKPKK